MNIAVQVFNSNKLTVSILLKIVTLQLNFIVVVNYGGNPEPLIICLVVSRYSLEQKVMRSVLVSHQMDSFLCPALLMDL